MSPPLRDAANQPVLWNGLRDGLIQTVATDHAPFDFQSQKQMGRSDFTKIPNGIPSLEERINLLYTHGVKGGPDRPAHARQRGEHPGREDLRPLPAQGDDPARGDADLVVFDPDYRGVISAKTQHMNVDYSAFEGWKIEGRPSVVTVRGEVAVRDGSLSATPLGAAS
jgi:dihydropyrimidinase